MEIILRDASSLARACGQVAQSKIDAFLLDPEVRFSVHIINGEDQRPISQALEAASVETMQQIDDVQDLFETQSRIRALAFKANASRVSDLLAERDSYLKGAVTALEDTYLGSTKNSRHGKHDAKEVAARLRGVARRMETVTNDLVSDSVRAPKLSPANEASIEDRLAALRRRQREISRELSKANIGQTIVLPDDIVTILRTHKII